MSMVRTLAGGVAGGVGELGKSALTPLSLPVRAGISLGCKRTLITLLVLAVVAGGVAGLYLGVGKVQKGMDFAGKVLKNGIVSNKEILIPVAAALWLYTGAKIRAHDKIIRAHDKIKHGYFLKKTAFEFGEKKGVGGRLAFTYKRSDGATICSKGPRTIYRN